MRRIPVVFAMLVLLPAAGRAQEAELCDLVDDPNRQLTISNRNTPYETYFVTDAVFMCPGGRRVAARNATYLVATGQITLDGNVEIDEPERTLRAEFAQYFAETRQMHARTNVVLRDLRTGSVIESALLDMFQASPERPQSLIVATGGMPRATLFEERTDGTRDSTIVDAREIRIIGDRSFRAIGEAVMRRDSLTARGSTIDYAEDQRRLEVAGAAQVETSTQSLRGDSITATLDEGDRISDVLARHQAALEGDDMDVTAPAIRLLFEDGGVSRMVAMTWELPAGAAEQARPLAVSPEFRLESDSIDVLAPGQQLQEAVAIGNARGERIMPDSLKALLPEGPPEIMELISSDWMRGDSVRAHFAPNPRAGTDTTASKTIMERLSAWGDQAQSMYGLVEQGTESPALAFNYLRASYIEVNFMEGRVANVAASGDARGVYLQPGEAAQAIRSESAGPGGRR